MGGYGYTYRSFSAYNTVRGESSGPVIKPFAPFVPNINRSSEGYVTKKTIVPVADRPYSDDYNNKHGFPAEAYPVRDDDERHRQTPKIDDFFSRPARHSPETSPNKHQSTQPTAYNGAAGYGDYGNKEGRNPIGSTIRNDNPNGYDGVKGYGDYGNYSNKQGRKPIPITTGNDDYDAYNSPKGYGDYDNYSNREGHRPIGSTPRNDDHDGYSSPKGYGDYGNYSNKEGHRHIGSTPRDDGYGGYNSPKGYGDHGNYRNKEGHRPIGSAPRDDDYDDYHNPTGYGDYGNYRNREGHKPTGSPIRNDNYDGNDYGNYGSREGQKPIASTIRKPAENYRDREPNKITPATAPKISSAWTALPRKGTQLSEATNDIGKAVELLKEAAKPTPNGRSGGVSGYGDHNDKGGHKASGNAFPNDNYGNYQRRHDVMDRPAEPPGSCSHPVEPTSKVDKGLELVKEAERLKQIATGNPRYRSSVPIEPARSNKVHFGENVDSSERARRYGNYNRPSRLSTAPTQRTTIVGPDYGDNIDNRDTLRRYGNTSRPVSTINSREAEKKYGGRIIV